jgi:predicted RNA-binding Zn ribbon-like protein
MGTTPEQVLLDLLNSTPVTADGPVDLLGGDWARERGGVGSGREVTQLRQVRDHLQAVVREVEPATTLAPLFDGVRMRPEVDAEGLHWLLEVDDDRRLGAEALLAWGRLNENMPGRLRACANDECRLFLLDRSHANSARWCSMKVCGNRMKVRRHYRRKTSEV